MVTVIDLELCVFENVDTTQYFSYFRAAQKIYVGLLVT